ncbi:MAG: hypothetical protein A4E49_03099 [Methanosaeta sp. PtaU1.Bin112]|nr:MAG: hypothetical protein A4E49_03099 [Methanosaeta sp. PtaU1.Bin112]
MSRSKSRNRTARGGYIRSTQGQRPGRHARRCIGRLGIKTRKNFDESEGAGGFDQFQLQKVHKCLRIVILNKHGG